MLRRPRCLLAFILLCGVAQVGESKADGPPFIAHLPQGTAELLGVTEDFRPTKESRWWQSDGSAASIGSFRALQKYPQPGLVADDKFRTFLVRFENLPADASFDPVGGVNFSTTPQGPLEGTPNWIAGVGEKPQNPTQFFTGSPSWDAGTYTPTWVATSVYCGLKVQDASSRSTARYATADSHAACYPLRDEAACFYRMFATKFAGPAQTTDLRIGVSMGEWETVITRSPDSAGKSSFCRDGREWTVMFSKPTVVRKRNATRIILKSSSYTYGQWNKRLVAVAIDGSEHASSIPGNLDGDYGTLFFDDLPLPLIREFRLQVRRFCCVEFDNISLQAGQKTDVKVVSPDASANSEK
jgi:hypothetical protein